MVKEAAQQTKAVLSGTKQRRQTAPAAGSERAAAVPSLRDEAANFAKIQQRVKSDEKTYAGEQRNALYDTRCYFNVRSKADVSQLNLPHCNYIHPFTYTHTHTFNSPLSGTTRVSRYH